MTKREILIEQHALDFLIGQGLDEDEARLEHDDYVRFGRELKVRTLAELEDAVKALGDEDNSQWDKAIDAVIELIRKGRDK